ncbi:MAG: hypothetical protein QOI29_5656 [Mycobacterium sp.]|jgi:hypothetical protein|nr:hypothetical protein [Mycobacterium sp.]
MGNVAQPAGSQPFHIPEQTGAPARVNAAPLYLPNVIAAMVASVAVVIGSLGPWMTFLVFSRSNVDGDGMFTLALGMVSGVALFALFNIGRSRPESGWMVALACAGALAGLGSFVIGVIDVFGVMNRKTELFGQTIGPQVGWGLWLVLIASLVLIATSIVVAVQIPKLRGE